MLNPHSLLKSLAFAAVILLPTAAVIHAQVPETAPRTWVVDGGQERFREFALKGEGASSFALIKADFDRIWMNYEFPEQPTTYGDPDPRKRTPEKVVLWRDAQDVSNRVATVAEAATLIWLATGEEVYLEKAREFLLSMAEWGTDGVSDIYYNDEAHFRLWRKFPMVFDQIRDELTAAERQKVLQAFEVRGRRSTEWILSSGVMELKRNSIERRPSSHPVRFMAMMGLTGLALWDDLPEAREWYELAYTWYHDIFTPWGGDDGGWAEGVAYWRGVYEHATFHDALLAIGDKGAYADPFWRNTGYFPVYTIQPYRATSFGDLSNAGKFNMEPGVAHFVNHLGRVLNDGYLVAYANLFDGIRPYPGTAGIPELSRLYPVDTEYLVREFIAAGFKDPEPADLLELPTSRYFSDIGWVAMHSALGHPEEDIHLLFKSSPYGSFSHSHADQNAFILNAYGKNLAINSGYREFHRSLQHRFYTRQSKSKNMVLIDMRGQEVQTEKSCGQIVHFEEGDGYVWTAGDATEAYQLMQSRKRIDQARRDILFVDNRYFVMKDSVKVNSPSILTWLLHAEKEMEIHEDEDRIVLENDGAYLHVRLMAPGNSFGYRQRTGFTYPVDPPYTDQDFVDSLQWLLDVARDQYHLSADLKAAVADGVIWSLLWPSKEGKDGQNLHWEYLGDNTIKVQRPDGKIDTIRLTEDSVVITTD
jgi:hypothetical protein